MPDVAPSKPGVPLYRIIWRDGYYGGLQTWDSVLSWVRHSAGNRKRGTGNYPVRVERVSCS